MADDATDGQGNTWRAREISLKKFAASAGLLADAAVHGEATIAATEAALPSVVGRCFYLRAPRTNQGSVYIGGAGVTAALGWELEPGDVLPFEIQVSNLNVVHAIAAQAGDKLRYWGKV